MTRLSVWQMAFVYDIQIKISWLYAIGAQTDLDVIHRVYHDTIWWCSGLLSDAGLMRRARRSEPLRPASRGAGCPGLERQFVAAESAQCGTLVGSGPSP